jgi:hypothetical protein
VFKTDISVSDSFGVPISASATGLVMDADRILSSPKALDGSQRLKLEFMRHSGINSSAFEHLVPEQLWSTSDGPVYGVSAVKALELANAAGIPIYVVTGENVDTVLPQLEVGQEVKDDIRAAVAAGNEVMVPKTNITYNGWTGCGYVVTDPTTGAGAYMITGGDAGAYLALLLGAAATGNPVLAAAIAAKIFIQFVTWIAQDLGELSVTTQPDWCGPKNNPTLSAFIPDYPFGIDVTAACRFHDDCYEGKHPGWPLAAYDKSTCDRLLGDYLTASCVGQTNAQVAPTQFVFCVGLGEGYEAGVTIWGGKAYSDARRPK